MTRVKKSLLVLLAVLAFGLIGCGESVSNLAGVQPVDPTLPPGTIPPPRGDVPPPEGVIGGFKTGSTTEFIPVSTAKMSQYAMRTLSNPKNVRINVSLDNFGGGAIGGFIKLAYDDNGQYVEATFNAGENSHDAQFNRWFTHEGKEVFHGFFEDEYGAVVLVIDDVLNLGDGGEQDTVSGSLWFRNHRVTAQTGPNPSSGCLPGFGCPSTRCWFVKIGPYSCRSFLENDKIDTTSRLYPNNGYVKLGSFSGLSRNVAFAGN